MPIKKANEAMTSVQIVDNLDTIGNKDSVSKQIQAISLAVQSENYHSIADQKLMKDSLNGTDTHLKYALAVEPGQNKIIGYIFYEVHRGNVIYVSHITVLPQYRRSSVGLQLMQRVFRFADSIGSRRVCLCTSSGFGNPALRFNEDIPIHIPGFEMKKEVFPDLTWFDFIRVDQAMALKDIDWGKNYAYRPKLLGENKVGLKQQGMAYHLPNGKSIPIYWIESADKIPMERREKILHALIGGGLLAYHTGKQLDENSHLIIEYFDDRGDNRRVLLVSQDDQQPFVLKYVHQHIRAAAEQQSIMGQVINYEQSLEQGSIYKKLEKAYGVDLVPVPKPGKFVRVDGTEFLSEEFIDGPTRKDLIDYLTKVKGYSLEAVNRLLARIEGQSLSRIWQGTKDITKGQVLDDLHGNNAKFVRVNGWYLARYFDFEKSHSDYEVGALQTYMNNHELPQLNEDEFILGWAEGLGYQKAFDFFRMISFWYDKLGIIIRLINAVKEASDSQERAQFYITGEHAGKNPVDDIKQLSLFIYRILTNQRITELPHSREQMAKDINRVLSTEFKYSNVDAVTRGIG